MKRAVKRSTVDNVLEFAVSMKGKSFVMLGGDIFKRSLKGIRRLNTTLHLQVGTSNGEKTLLVHFEVDLTYSVVEKRATAF